MSKILYKALGTTSLKEVINDVKAATGELEVDFFGVGALARNVWYIEHDENPRGTKMKIKALKMLREGIKEGLDKYLSVD
jgi:hypothetical protein